MEIASGLIGLATALVGVWQVYASKQSKEAVPAGSVPRVAAVALPQERRNKLVLGTVLRDAGVIFLVTLVLGAFIGYAATDEESLLASAAAVNVISLLVGLTVSATKAPDERWKHLGAVAGVIWVLSIVNVVLGVVPLSSWLLGLALIAVCTLVAGGASYLFRKS